MQLSAALLSVVIVGAAAAAQVCPNEDGITTTGVLNLSCGCPGPTTTIYEYTTTVKSTADCHGCSGIIAFTTVPPLRCPRLPCVGILATPSASVIILDPPTTITEFFCSATP